MSSRRRASRPDHAEERRPRRRETFAQTYPHLTKWVRGSGWIEWGDALFPLERRSCIRALDEGGLIWAGKETYREASSAPRGADGRPGGAAGGAARGRRRHAFCPHEGSDTRANSSARGPEEAAWGTKRARRALP